jgi:outer membrane protein OmpU
VNRDLRAQETTKTQERSMKKVLLTTTALVMTAGVAAAEISFSGKTQVNVTSTGTADNVLNTHVDLNAAVSGSFDNGMTMSTSLGFDAGREADYNDDFALDAAESGWSTASPNMTIGYAGYTITADGEGVDDLYNGDVTTGNLGLAGTMGDITFGVTTNIDGNASASSYKLGYTTGDITATLTGSNDADASSNDASKLVISYKMGDTTITATSDDSDANADAITKLGFSTKLDAITVSYTAASTGASGSDLGDDWDAKIAYSAGALTASYSLDEDDVSKLVAEYDLGGGATAFASMKNGATAAADFQAIGINFKF